MVTIKDISQKSGYSVATVSKALNGYADVSDDVKETICKIAKAMGYYPSAIARDLRLQIAIKKQCSIAGLRKRATICTISAFARFACFPRTA